MKAAVIGASGFIGGALYDEGLKRGHEVSGTYRGYVEPGLTKLDAKDSTAVKDYLERLRPDWVLMPAANPNVELCEKEPEATRKDNVEAVEHVASACRMIGSRLVFFSSDYVFDGLNGPYREEDEMNPISEYGRQKLVAERLIQELLPKDHLIARATVVYGWEVRGKNFVARLIANLREAKEVKVPYDQIGSPTLVDDLAEAVWSLVERGARGTFHVAGSSLMSRYDFAVEVAKAFELPQGLIVPVDTPSLGQLAPRPLRAGMICDKAEAFIGRAMLGASEGLARLRESEAP